MTHPMNAEQLLGTLESQGRIHNKAALADHISRTRPDRELPLYVRALAGVGATIGALCFALFLFEADLIEFRSHAGLLFWGLVAICGAIWLFKSVGPDARTARHSFFLQGSFTFMALGKGLFVAGLAEMTGSAWGITIGLGLVTLGTWFVYDISVDRFLSALGVLLSLAANILMEIDHPVARPLLLDLMFLAALGGAAWLFTSPRVRHAFMPLGYALAAALSITVLMLSARLAYGPWQARELIDPGLINASLGIALVLLAGYVAGGFDRLRPAVLAAISVTAALLALVSAPGILLALILMVLGYARHDTIMLRSGGFLLPLVLLQYYANMDVTLLVKSGVLVASGVVLLGARAWLSGRDLVKGAKS